MNIWLLKERMIFFLTNVSKLLIHRSSEKHMSLLVHLLLKEHSSKNSWSQKEILISILSLVVLVQYFHHFWQSSLRIISFVLIFIVDLNWVGNSCEKIWKCKQWFFSIKILCNFKVVELHRHCGFTFDFCCKIEFN